MSEETRPEAEQQPSLEEPKAPPPDTVQDGSEPAPTEDGKSQKEDAAQAPLPGGLILSRNTIKALLGQEYDTVAAKDDPILMVAALLNAYLDEMKKQAGRLREGFEQDTSQPALQVDGIGLSLDALRVRLAQEHNAVVTKDDPILMVGTLLNAYLGEVEKQNARLREGMAKLLTEKTDSYTKGVKAATDSLAQSLTDSSVQGIRKVFDDNSAALQTFRKNVAWTAAIVAVSALVNVIAFVLLVRL